MNNNLQLQQFVGYTFPSSMDIQQEVEKIKKELAELIVAHLKQNKIHVDLAQKQAADFLAVLPIKDQRDLLEKLQRLGNTYQEMREIYVKELTRYNEEQREHALLKMRNAIAEGNIDHALGVAKELRAKHENSV